MTANKICSIIPLLKGSVTSLGRKRKTFTQSELIPPAPFSWVEKGESGFDALKNSIFLEAIGLPALKRFFSPSLFKRRGRGMSSKRVQNLSLKNTEAVACHRKILLVCAITVLLSSHFAFAQSTQVKLSASVAATQVPLNRTATYTVQLKWSGNLALIEFDQPETPRLTNFKLAGSSSSNWVGVESGQNTSIKTFEYTLRPEALGMGYVEGLRLSYLDKATNEKHTLYADRLGIEVIDPLPEPGEVPVGLLASVWLGIVAAVAMIALVWRARNQKKEAALRAAALVVKPFEQEMLEQLQASVDLNSLDTKAGFSEISKILRQYLKRRFEIPAAGITTAEVVAAYRGLDTSVDQAMKLEEILQTSDVIKFSGESGEPAKLARCFALAESFLRTNLNTPSSTISNRTADQH